MRKSCAPYAKIAVMDLNERCTFFFQVPLGLEQLALKELNLKFPGLFPAKALSHAQIEEGGFTMELPLNQGLTLNYWLKIPNRILLRFAHFKCRDLPKLFNKISKLPWSPFFAGQDYTIKVSAKKSRLFDERKIIKTTRDALNKVLKAQEPKAIAKKRVQSFKDWHLFIRFEEDWCTLSIDTSGERLGLRGYKTRVGVAPLRENLASALFFFCALSFKEENEGLTRALTIVDPFCGSGTLLCEAALFFEPNLFRNYAFEFFAGNDKFQRPSSFRLERELFLLGSDCNEERVQDTLTNIKEASLSTLHHHIQVGDLTQKEFRKRLSHEIFAGEIAPWLLSNPPYGKRVPQELSARDLLEEFKSWGPFERIGLLLPREQLAGLTPPKGILHHAHLDFVHGGDKVRFAIFECQRP